MARYGAEGLPYALNSLLVSDTTFTSSGVNAIGIQAPSGATGCQLSNPRFAG
jgi:hypothetical protein